MVIFVKRSIQFFQTEDRRPLERFVITADYEQHISSPSSVSAPKLPSSSSHLSQTNITGQAYIQTSIPNDS